MTRTFASLNKRATAIFNKLTDGLTKLGDHRKFDNAPGAFMACCVELVEQTRLGPIFSIAHYHEVNSDLCRDPEVLFLRSDSYGIVPLSFRQDNLGIDRTHVVVQQDGHLAGYPRQQCDLTRFANQWAKNISDQQF